MLFQEFESDLGLVPQIVPVEEAIVFSNPTETFKNSANRLSLWLFRIEENEFQKNQPYHPVTGNGADPALGLPPLSLDLTYLITPVTGNPESELHLMGRVMQALYDHPVLRLNDPDEEIQEELRIILGRVSLEELTRIWEALNEPYRLSITYRVRVTRIRSKRKKQVGLIEDSRRGYGEAPAGVGGGA